jgi:hypothetical protein
MAYHIYLVDDPNKGPTHGQKAGGGSVLFFKSMGLGGNPPPVFTLKFQADFDGKWVKSQSDNPTGNSGVAGRTWVSQPSGDYQLVKIKLRNVTHPADGYAYDVTMNGNTWDPRVVPK